MLEFQNLILQIPTINESSILFIAIAIASFLILWAVVSIPVWISAKILKAKQAKFTRAMLVTAFGPIIYGIVYFVSTRILSSVLLSPAGSSVNMIGIAIAFIVWIYVFKRGFKTGWIRALGISIAAIAVFVIIGIIIFFAASQFISHTQPQTPRPPPPTVVPPLMPFQQV
ncbi:MAG: hypothetical protein ACJ71G_02430 [Nitrososphaeraceae archaeon]